MNNLFLEQLMASTKLPIRVMDLPNRSDVVIEVTAPTGKMLIEPKTKELMEEKSGLFSHSERYEYRNKTVMEIMQEIWNGTYPPVASEQGFWYISEIWKNCHFISPTKKLS